MAFHLYYLFMSEQEVPLEINLLIQNPHLEKTAAQREDMRCPRSYISCHYQPSSGPKCSLMMCGERYFLCLLLRAFQWTHFRLFLSGL